LWVVIRGNILLRGAVRTSGLAVIGAALLLAWARPAFASSPSTSIDSGPSGVVSTTSATFAFSGDDGAGSPAVYFECRLDASDWSSCASPITYTGLPDAPHTFFVAAMDPSGTVADPAPPSRTFTVDTTSPDTSIDSGPSGSVGSSDATFRFSGTEPIRTVAVWGSAGSAPGQFVNPYSIAVAPNGNVYVTDQGNSRVQVFDPSGVYLFSWGVIGPAPGQLNGPTGIAISPGGEVFVSDTGNNRVEVFDLSGNFLRQWGTSGNGNGLFNSPRGIALGGAGNVYVADAYNSRIQKFDPFGTFLTKWGSNGTGNGQFKYPFGVAVGAGGNVYVVDYWASVLQKFDPSGTYLARWGGYGTGDGLFRYPYGVTVGPDGNVYVADTFNQRVQEFDPSGTLLGRFGGSKGTANGQYNMVYSVAFGLSGQIYVADLGNSRVQMLSGTVASYRCQLDGGALSPCSSPVTYSGLADGSHSFSVQAVDQSGIADPTPATRSWSVDTAGTTTPDTAITGGPSGWVAATSATFTFTGTDGSGAPATGFGCQLDGGAWVACGSPQTYAGLGDGAHVFSVRSLDGSGLADPSPATRTWSVDTTAPATTILTHPATPTGVTAASFTFSATDFAPGSGVASYQCHIDVGAWAACGAPWSYTGLADGSHTFEVRGTDVVGNVGAPASYTWLVDTAAPVAAPTQSPAANGAGWNNAGVTASWSWTDTGSGIDVANCATSSTSSGQGTLTLSATCKDLAGNTASASYTVKVDKTLPTVPTLSEKTAGKTATLTFTATDPTPPTPPSGVASVQCRLMSGTTVVRDWAACTSPFSYSNLVKGTTYTALVRAVDVAGNVGNPSTVGWTQ
jgi:DNA-binding beta-propeller fold protein YncE